MNTPLDSSSCTDAQADTGCSRPLRSFFHLGAASLLADPTQRGPLNVPAHHFVTHGVVVGMTGSGNRKAPSPRSTPPRRTTSGSTCSRA